MLALRARESFVYRELSGRATIVIVRCRQEVQADLARHTSTVYTLLDPKIKADVGVQRCR